MFKCETERGKSTFEVGDIVERWVVDKHWQYWTTIHTREDAEAAMLLDTAFYRVVRGPEKALIW